MSRLNLDAPTQAVVLAPTVTMFALIEFGFDSGTIYLTDCAHDITWSGQVYTTALGLGTIDVITETDTESRGLSFEMSATHPSQIASALTEQVQGRSIIIRLVMIDPDTAELRVDPNIWSGKFDVMQIEDNSGSALIRVTAEHALITWQTKKGTLASDVDQKLRYSNDRFFEWAAKMTEATIVWPNKEFGKI